VKLVEVAAESGYEAIEPWLRELDAYTKGGGSLKDLGKRIADLGMTVESAIGFAPWLVNDDEKRAKGVEQMKRDMDAVAQIGGKRIAPRPSEPTAARTRRSIFSRRPSATAPSAT